jgi:hypothetical protein
VELIKSAELPLLQAVTVRCHVMCRGSATLTLSAELACPVFATCWQSYASTACDTQQSSSSTYTQGHFLRYSVLIPSRSIA